MTTNKPTQPPTPVPNPTPATEHYRESRNDKISPRDPISKAPPEPPRKK